MTMPDMTASNNELREKIYAKVYHGLTMAEADHYTDWIMALITADRDALLDRLEAQAETYDDIWGGEVRAVPLAAIEAERSTSSGKEAGMTDKEQMELDDAVRTFAGYVRGDNGFDELDFKEWLLDWRDKAVAEATIRELEWAKTASVWNIERRLAELHALRPAEKGEG